MASDNSRENDAHSFVLYDGFTVLNWLIFCVKGKQCICNLRYRPADIQGGPKPNHFQEFVG